jgi:predicted AlkP superfamily pyrophosphatase or phosphodiesterase
MLKRCGLALLIMLLAVPGYSISSAWPEEQPKLIVFLVIDQFRADQLTTYRSKFKKNGFNSLLKDAAYFPFAEYDVLQSMTAPGHATVLTGAYPYQSGIPTNEWIDPKTKKLHYCVEDTSMETVGAPTKINAGTSPKNLIGTTVGDELKNKTVKSRVVTVALKDRAAILMGGHRADLAMWFDKSTQRWVSSKYYLKDGQLPEWINLLNKGVTPCEWYMPCGVDMTVNAAIAALQQNQMGQDDNVDLLAVSFSSHDYSGHRFGPHSSEIETMLLAEDEAIGKLQTAVAKQVKGGLKNVVFVLTGDHGVSPSPDFLSKAKIPNGRIDEEALRKDMEKMLKRKFGSIKSSQWITGVRDLNFYLDQTALKKNKDLREKIEAEMKVFLLEKPEFAHVFSRTDVEKNQLPPGQFRRQIEKTYFRGRSGDVVGIPKPFFINTSKNTADHMTGYSYDRTVPLLFSGFGIQKGTHASKAEVVDIAPTLSFLLGIVPPALSEGKVLESALQ